MDGQDGVPTYLMFSSLQIQNGIPKRILMRTGLYNTMKLEEKWQNFMMMFLDQFVSHIEIKTK